MLESAAGDSACWDACSVLSSGRLAAAAYKTNTLQTPPVQIQLSVLTKTEMPAPWPSSLIAAWWQGGHAANDCAAEAASTACPS